jgi:hypothetical protein
MTITIKTFKLTHYPIMLWFAFASSLIAASGGIEYKIRDTLTHHPVKAATIKLIAQSNIRPVTVTGDQTGHARIIGILPGEYGVEISAPDYEPMRTHTRITNTVSLDNGFHVPSNLHATGSCSEQSLRLRQ